MCACAAGKRKKGKRTSGPNFNTGDCIPTFFRISLEVVQSSGSRQNGFMKRPYSIFSLRASLLLLVLLATLPAFGLMLYTNAKQHEIARQQVRDHALQLARSTAANYNQTIEGVRQMMAALAQLPAVQAHNGKRCSLEMANLMKHYPLYANIGVAGADGRVFCSAIPLQHPVNAAGHSWFQRAQDRLDFAVGTYEVGPISHLASIDFAYPVLTRAGQVDAVIFVALDLRWLTQIMAQMRTPPGTTLALIDSNGTILNRYPDPYAWMGRKVQQVPMVTQILKKQSDGTMDADGLDHVPRLYGYTPLLAQDLSTLYLLVGVPPDAAYAPVDRAFRHALLGMLLVALVALAAAWLTGYLLILRRANRLVGVTTQLSAGNLSARTGMSYAGGEFGDLARSFDQMGEAMQLREAQARKADVEIRLLQTMTMAISAAEDLPAAFSIALKKICDATGWPIGQAWTPAEDGRTMECNPGWYSAVPGLEAFREDSLHRTFPPGYGLVGTVWQNRQPLWLQDLAENRFFMRRGMAARLGLKSCMVFPVLANETVVAVIEFYAFEARPEDRRLVDLVYAVGTQLGALIQRKRAEERIRYMAYNDPLTRLPNRAALEQRMATLMDTVQDEQETFALLNLEVRRFTEVNNTLGYDNGDKVFRQIGPRIRSILPGEAVVARLSGTLFAVLLPQGDVQTAVKAATDILKVMEIPFPVADLSVELSPIIGIAIYPAHGNNVNLLIQHANVALTEAQQTETGYAIYSPQADPYSARRLTILGDFRRAIRENQLLLYCQPKINMKSRQLAGVEALVRWQHPQYQLIAPDQFLPFVEQTGLIMPLSNWMINESLATIGRFQKDGFRIPIAVNLSARNLRDIRLIDTMNEALAKWQSNVRLLELEITESSVMEDPAQSIGMLDRLSTLGFHLFIDDFGTGYSSLSYLKKMPFNALKIDKSFVRDMTSDSDALMIVRAIIELGHNLGLKVVAEGVETQAIWDKLEAFGCDEAQGNLISPPMPASQLLAWYKASPWCRSAGPH